MSYKLKTTGIAANCVMCIAVDPDDGVVKDFASAAVTADMTVHANVVIADGTWNGVTRKTFDAGPGVGEDIAFGLTKPHFKLDGTTNTQVTVVAIGEVGSNQIYFGTSSSNYFASRSEVTGSGHPFLHVSSSTKGGSLATTAGEKRIFGYSVTHGGNATGYSALHDASAMTVAHNSTFASGTSAADWALNYINRRNDTASNGNGRPTFAVLIFDTHLTEAQWNSLRADWFSTLLEVASGSASITISPTTQTVQVGAAPSAWINRGTPAPTGGVKYNLTSSNPAVATIQSTATINAGASTTNISGNALTAGTTTITATNAADSNETATATINVTTSLVKKLKLLAHIDALGATAVAGDVHKADNTYVGRFTGAAFGTSAEAGDAPLKVAVADFGGASLTTADTLKVSWEATSAAGSALGAAVPIGSAGDHAATVIEE